MKCGQYCWDFSLVVFLNRKIHFPLCFLAFRSKADKERGNSKIFLDNGENASHQHFLLFSLGQSSSSSESKLYVPGSSSEFVICKCFNSFPNNEILDRSKSKAFAGHKINVTEKLKFVWGKVENMVGKGDNAHSQHFLFECFQKNSFLGQCL